MAKTPKQKRSAKSVRVLVLPHGAGLPLPDYQTSGAAGFDLLAAVPDGKPLKIKRGGFALVPTGLIVEIPRGFEAQVRPRSGLAAKFGVTVLNAPGTIDSDYRGEVQVILINHGPKTFVIERGARIAQIVLAAVTRAAISETRAVSGTARGAAGFGSTGTSARAKVPPAKKTKARSVSAKTSAAKTSAASAYPRRRIARPTPRRH